MAFIDWGRWAELNKDKGEEMAAQALDDKETKRIFGAADQAVYSASKGGDYNKSAIEEADAKRKALQSISGAGGLSEQISKKGGSIFDAALMQGSQTMGNAYAQMGDYQQRIKDAQQQAADRKVRQDYAAQKHALGQIAQSDRNAAALAQWEKEHPDLLALRSREQAWRRGESGGDYAGYSDYREQERQKSKPTRQKSIWDFFGR